MNIIKEIKLLLELNDKTRQDIDIIYKSSNELHEDFSFQSRNIKGREEERKRKEEEREIKRLKDIKESEEYLKLFLKDYPYRIYSKEYKSIKGEKNLKSLKKTDELEDNDYCPTIFRSNKDINGNELIHYRFYDTNMNFSDFYFKKLDLPLEFSSSPSINNMKVRKIILKNIPNINFKIRFPKEENNDKIEIVFNTKIFIKKYNKETAKEEIIDSKNFKTLKSILPNLIFKRFYKYEGGKKTSWDYNKSEGKPPSRHRNINEAMYVVLEFTKPKL